MESLKESCDPNDVSWKDSPTLMLIEAASAGITAAQKELDRRQARIKRELQSLE